jgi:hypothetical protein
VRFFTTLGLLALLGQLATACSHAPTDTASPMTAQRKSAATAGAISVAPVVGATWHWQLTGIPALDYDVDVYDLDLEYLEQHPQVIQTLKAHGKYVLCYIDVGGWEAGRSDADDFPEELKTKYMPEWDEWYLDVSQLDDFGPIGSKKGMRTLTAARFDRAAAVGCDGVEPDVLDAFENNVPRISGGYVDWQDQYALMLMLVQEAHARGLSIGLKNLLEYIPAEANGFQDLSLLFDWTIQEQAYQYDTPADVAERLDLFVELGKPVFLAEYRGDEVRFRDVICPSANAHGYHALKFPLMLNGPPLFDCRWP